MTHTDEANVMPPEIDEGAAATSPMAKLEEKLDIADKEIVMVRTAMWFPIIAIIMSSFIGFFPVMFLAIL
ncbi:hypothetical protein [uncultured Psychrobacter sp.]|uniref:hypothetical protein n=1 Tax=uncultured Psychrobacter sp. TaxID=259303 RepID=UPI0030DDC14B